MLYPTICDRFVSPTDSVLSTYKTSQRAISDSPYWENAPPHLPSVVPSIRIVFPKVNSRFGIDFLLKQVECLWRPGGLRGHAISCP